MEFDLKRLRLYLCLFGLFALVASWAQPARADQAHQVWSMALTYGRTVAVTDTSTNTITTYGTGIADPFTGAEQGGSDFTTLAMTADRTLYLLRRDAFTNTDTIRLYSLSADNIIIDGNNLISNVKFLGVLSYNGVNIKGNVDGFTAGPDGNLYFTAYDITNGAPTGRNGLYRIHTSTLPINPAPVATSQAPIDFVGTFANNQGPGNPSSFYTDMAFDPITGDLVGIGIPPNSPGPANTHQTLYRIPAANVLGNLVNQTFAWNYFNANWANVDLSAMATGKASWQNPDGVAFTPEGNLYLSGDGEGNANNNSGLVQMDRATGLALVFIPGSIAGNIGYDLAIPPPQPSQATLSISGLAYCDTNKNGVPDPGEGEAGVTVTLRMGNTVIGVVTTNSNQPTANGNPAPSVQNYSFDSLVPGNYTVTVTQTVLPDGCTLASLNPVPVTITVAGGNVANVNFRYVPPVPTPDKGRMTGGGSIFTADGTRVTHGFELHCDPTAVPNSLEINFAKHRFHLGSLTTAGCSQMNNIFTLFGTGTGDFDGVGGYTISFVFTDAGEPGTSDFASYLIKDPLGNVVLDTSGLLDKGNHQWHKK